MGNLSEIYALIDSKDETNIQLAFAMWSGIDSAGFEAFKKYLKYFPKKVGIFRKKSAYLYYQNRKLTTLKVANFHH